MTIQAGDRLPDVPLSVATGDGRAANDITCGSITAAIATVVAVATIVPRWAAIRATVSILVRISRAACNRNASNGKGCGKTKLLHILVPSTTSPRCLICSI